MANKENTKVLICDSLGAVTTRTIRIKSIIVQASADNWAVTLNDKNGNKIFGANTALANDRTKVFPLEGVEVDGVTAITLTSITGVYIYTE